MTLFGLNPEAEQSCLGSGQSMGKAAAGALGAVGLVACRGLAPRCFSAAAGPQLRGAGRQGPGRSAPYQQAGSGFGVAAAAGTSAAVLASVSRGRRFCLLQKVRCQTQVRKVMTTAVQKTPIQTQIEELIALQPVILFSKSTCPFCTKARDAFKSVGASRVPEVQLDKMAPGVQEEIQNHLQALTGARTVPRVFIGKKCIGGGTETAKLAESGELKKTLQAATEQHAKDLQGEADIKLKKTEAEWRKELGPEAYRVLRQRGTEPPGSHEYDKFHPESGHFACGACELPLYSAESKFQSSCGWPVFDKCYHSEENGCHVGTRPDGTGSLEIFCPRCGSHLGHVFFDAHSKANPNGERH